MRESRKTKSTTKQQITMKKREFFKRLLGITAAAVVAPKALLAEEEVLPVDKASVKSYVSSIDFIDQREVAKYSHRPMIGEYVEDVISCNESTAEVFCKTSFLRMRDVIKIQRDGNQIGSFSMVTGFSKLPGEDMYRVRFRSATQRDFDVKKGDFLELLANSYPEK